MSVIYILTNEAMPDFIKIGRTENAVTARMLQLDTTGIPLPFQCYYAAEVENYQRVEKALHVAFDDFRVRKNREFFQNLDPHKVRAVLELMAIRDVTPKATLAIADKEMPGFGEQMRQISLKFVPTAILSRQVAVIRGQSLIINLPGQPKSIAETLEGLKDSQGQSVVHGIFAAVPYCIDLIGGPYLETHDEVCKAFRPKTAIRPPKD